MASFHRSPVASHRLSAPQSCYNSVRKHLKMVFIISIAITILGGTFIFRPMLMFHFQRNIYREEYIRRASTRIFGRIMGLFMVIFGLGVLTSAFPKDSFPARWGKTLWSGFAVVFCTVWVGGILGPLLFRFVPRLAAWSRTYNVTGDPKSERRRDSREIMTVVSVLILLLTVTALLARTG